MDRSLATLAQRLHARRQELDLTQQDVADAAEVSKAAVSQWERGDTKNLKLEHLFAVADRLRVHARWLALGQGAKIAAVVMIVAFVGLALPYSNSAQAKDFRASHSERLCIMSTRRRWRQVCQLHVAFVACLGLGSTISAWLKLFVRLCERPSETRHRLFRAVADFCSPTLGVLSPRSIPTSPRPFETH